MSIVWCHVLLNQTVLLMKEIWEVAKQKGTRSGDGLYFTKYQLKRSVTHTPTCTSLSILKSHV